MPAHGRPKKTSKCPCCFARDLPCCPHSVDICKYLEYDDEPYPVFSNIREGLRCLTELDWEEFNDEFCPFLNSEFERL